MEHPITPPTELVLQWVRQWQQAPYQAKDIYRHIAAKAAQWGADQELEACCVEVSWFTADKLRASRRPKPPSLKEEALAALGADGYSMLAGKRFEPVQLEIIRRALEALPND